MTILTKSTDKKKLLPIPTVPIAVSAEKNVFKIESQYEQKQQFQWSTDDTDFLIHLFK